MGSRSSTALRWILALPAGAAAALLVSFPIHWLVMLNLGGWGIEPFIEIEDPETMKSIERFLQSVLGPLAFVYVGARTAPARRVAVAVVFSLAVVLGVRVLALTILKLEWTAEGLPVVLFNVVGAMGGIFLTRQHLRSVNRQARNGNQALDALRAAQDACDDAFLRLEEHSKRASRRAESQASGSELSVRMHRNNIHAMDLYNAGEIDAYGAAMDEVRRAIAQFGALLLALPHDAAIRTTSLELHDGYLKDYLLATAMYSRAASLAMGTALAGRLEATRRKFDALILTTASSNARGSESDKATAKAKVEEAERLTAEFQQLEIRSRDAEVRAELHVQVATQAFEKPGFIPIEP